MANCPWCGTSQGTLKASGQYKRTLAGLHSPIHGALWWECPDCGRGWHRWPAGSEQHALAKSLGPGLMAGRAGRKTA